MTTSDELAAWAGTGNATRADSAGVSGWQIPEDQKALLIDRVHIVLEWSFGVEPGTRTVHYILPQDEARFANSSIDLWLRTLHHYGLHVSESDDPQRPG
ncbi:hypothetical protein [Streptomyces sp. NPDC005423]|uniref:hypothetical protein n=1 Tax=Streptomyces sp. NPDC005423 TaxID=3155343 RepID=UPI0033AFF6ED